MSDLDLSTPLATWVYLNRVVEGPSASLQALLEHGENELAAGNLGETGIGAATALACADHGMGVILTYNSHPEGADAPVEASWWAR